MGALLSAVRSLQCMCVCVCVCVCVCACACVPRVAQLTQLSVTVSRTKWCAIHPPFGSDNHKDSGFFMCMCRVYNGYTATGSIGGSQCVFAEMPAPIFVKRVE